MRVLLAVLGLVGLALALVTSIGIDFSHLMQSGSIDFRNRIVGVRLLEHGIDPYHHIWHEGDPEEFFDARNNIKMTVSKTTVTPALLVFYAPLAVLPYRDAQFVWLAAQWLFLLGTVWLWMREGVTNRQIWLTLCFAIGLTYTPAWRFELERGQCYALLIFLLAWWLTATRKAARRSEFIAGFVAGLLVTFRPQYALLLPFVALKRRGQSAGAAAGLLLGVAAPMLLQPSIWLEYASAMETNSDYYRHQSLPVRPQQVFPATVEGTPIAIVKGVVGNFPAQDLTVFALARQISKEPLPDAPFLVGFGALFLVWLWCLRRWPVEWLMPGVAAWIFLSDFVLPTARWGYYDLMVLNVALAGIAVARRFPWAITPCLIAVPAMWSLLAMDHAPIQLIYFSQALYVVSAIASLFWIEADVDGAARN